MTVGILTQVVEQVNIQTGLDVIIVRTFDKKGEWQLEVVFSGGAKVTGPVTADEVNAIESDLADRGWQIDPSIFSNGFNAKPPIEDGCGMLFALSAGMWPDDLGLAEVTL